MFATVARVEGGPFQNGVLALAPRTFVRAMFDQVEHQILGLWPIVVSLLLLFLPCFQPTYVDGDVFGMPSGAKLHIAGGWVHDTHQMRLHGTLKLWFCCRCGYFASQAIRGLGQPCLGVKNSNRAEYLSRIYNGQWPKVLSRAELARRGS